MAEDEPRRPNTGAAYRRVHPSPVVCTRPQWDWATRDGARAIDLLLPFKNVTVFYGHIHNAHHHMTGHIGHHAAMSTMFPISPFGASKFEFSPAELTVERGRPVTLVITATDYAHGFDLSEFKVRRDLIPGKENGRVYMRINNSLQVLDASTLQPIRTPTLTFGSLGDVDSDIALPDGGRLLLGALL